MVTPITLGSSLLMSPRRQPECADVKVRELVVFREAIARQFDAKAARQDRLEERIEELQAEHGRGEDELGELGMRLGQIDDAIRALLNGDSLPAAELMQERTAHSRRGPVGIRSAILEVMREEPDRVWAPRAVHAALGARAVTTSLRNVGNTMRKMAADGQLLRPEAHGAFALPADADDGATDR